MRARAAVVKGGIGHLPRYRLAFDFMFRDIQIEECWGDLERRLVR